MADFQVYLYMWDNRNFWGLPYPNRPSLIWIALGVGMLFNAAYALVQQDSHGLSIHLYVGLTLLNGLLCLTLGLFSFLKIEPTKLLQFDIDEISLQINHYFKRKQAIFSPLGFTLVGIACLKFVIVLLISFQSIRTSSILSVYLLDRICLANIALHWGLACAVKFVTQIMQRYCPVALGRLKAYGNAKQRVGADLLNQLKKRE